MKTNFCVKCKKLQPKGSFCVICGSLLEERISLLVKFNYIHAKKTMPGLKNDIKKHLNRLGVKNADIIVICDDYAAEVRYSLLGKQYSFSSTRQKSNVDNLQAITTFIHHRAIGIERGIEDIEHAFSGYLSLPSPEQANPYSNLSVPELRQLLKVHHPDTGIGNTETYQAILSEVKTRGEKNHE
jgi:hypothetical protein